MKWIILISGIIANSSASVLVKLAILPPRKFPSFSEPMAIFSNLPFWLGLCLYGVAFFLYSASLTRLPLNVAHHILTSGTIVAVTLFSIFLFHEPFHWTRLIGIALVIIGVALITARSV